MDFSTRLYLLQRERVLEERASDQAATAVSNGRTYTPEFWQRRRSPPPDPETLMRTWLPTPEFWLPQASTPSSSPQGHAAAAAARSNKRARVPASDEAIRGLRVVTGGSPGECAICLQDLDSHADPGDDAPTPLRAMPCSHAFHQHCIFQWLRRNAVCPLCRFQLPEKVEEEGETDEIEENRRRAAIRWEHYRTEYYRNRRTRTTPLSS